MKHDLGKGTILVTGGAGFIGSAIIAELNARGYENILVADYLGSDDRFKNLVPLRFEDYIEADTLLDELYCDDNVYSDVTTVFHLGACSSTTERNANYLLKNNYEYTKALALWALGNNARFIYASSAATYGDGSQGMDDQEENLYRYKPLNMYGYSKHLFDIFAQKHGLLDDIVGLKYFNVFGPNEYHKDDMRSVVNKSFHQISETGKVQLFKSYRDDYKDGEQLRDFLYIKDAVNMTLFLAENKEAQGLFNIGSGTANTWKNLVQAVFSAMNKEEKIDFIEMPEYLKSKYQYYTKANIDKLLSLGYEEVITSLNDAVHDYVTNYLALDERLLGEFPHALTAVA